jgi:hypothetical protein
VASNVRDGIGGLEMIPPVWRQSAPLRLDIRALTPLPAACRVVTA